MLRVRLYSLFIVPTLRRGNAVTDAPASRNAERCKLNSQVGAARLYTQMFKHTSFPRATWECRAGRAASRIRDVARDSRRSAPWRHSHAARGNENSGIHARRRCLI